MVVLSKPQGRALRKLKIRGGWHSAYQLQESMGTLNSLCSKGLVTKKQGLGSLAFPRTGIMYRAN
jgi:hypothetical protein